MTKYFWDSCAVLPLLEAHVVAAGCADPGALIVPHVILSLLHEHSEGKALPVGAREKQKEVNSSKIVTWVLDPEHCV